MTPAAERRLTRARTLAQSTLDLFARGQRGRNLEQHVTLGPADVWQDDQGHHCRCYGVQCPPQTNRTAAIVAWAEMVLRLTDERNAA